MVSLPEHLSAKPAGRTRLPREVMLQHQRDHVLEVASEVIAKRGYNVTTIDHIVSAAGIGVGTFYDFFANKEDCFLQAYERIVARGTADVTAAIPSDRPWPEQACAGLRALLGAIASSPLDARLALVEIQAAGPGAFAHHEATMARVASFLRSGREASPLTAELPDTLETAIAGGVLWLLQQRLMLGETDEVRSYLPDLVRIVVEPYLGEREADRLVAEVGLVSVPD